MNAFLTKWANSETLPVIRFVSGIEAGAVIPPVEAQPDLNPASEVSALKGQAVELWRDGRRYFVVADEEDAQEAIQRFGARRGEIWTSGELELVARFEDQATRDAVEALKRAR